jgi:hypothetical protein
MRRWNSAHAERRLKGVEKARQSREAQEAKVEELRALQGEYYGTGQPSPALVAYCDDVLRREFELGP